MSLEDKWAWLKAAGLKMPTTLEQLHAGSTFTGTPASSHELKAEEINSIRRLQSRGFRVIDLDPNLLDRDDFNTPYSSDILANIVGENLTTSNIDGSGVNRCPNPNWRTFSFDAPGNFLKIELLPVRQEMGNGLGSTPLEQPVSIEVPGTTQTANPAFIAEGSRRTILVDFEAPTASPHVVSDGTIFRTYFSAFLITVKNFNTRIRITIGYNSEIAEREEKETTLALFGGRGITTRYQVAPTPFSINNLDVNLASALGVEYPPPFNAKFFGLIINPDAAAPAPIGTPIGNSLVWITGFSASFVVGITPTTNDGMITADLVLCEVNALFLPTTNLKRIASLTTTIPASSRNGPTQNLVLSDAIRVSLPPRTGIFLRLRELTSIDGGVLARFIQFSLNGYTLGGFDANESSGLSVAPYFTNNFQKENPWPMDYAFDGIPQR